MKTSPADPAGPWLGDLARLLPELAPRLLLVEDLHWSDQTSQELLHSLARAIEEDCVLILGTYRRDELHRRHPLTHWLAELGRERRFSEVDLAPLAWLCPRGLSARCTTGKSRARAAALAVEHGLADGAGPQAANP